MRARPRQNPMSHTSLDRDDLGFGVVHAFKTHLFVKPRLEGRVAVTEEVYQAPDSFDLGAERGGRDGRLVCQLCVVQASSSSCLLSCHLLDPLGNDRWIRSSLERQPVAFELALAFTDGGLDR